MAADTIVIHYRVRAKRIEFPLYSIFDIFLPTSPIQGYCGLLNCGYKKLRLIHYYLLLYQCCLKLRLSLYPHCCNLVIVVIADL